MFACTSCFAVVDQHRHFDGVDTFVPIDTRELAHQRVGIVVAQRERIAVVVDEVDVEVAGRAFAVHGEPRLIPLKGQQRSAARLRSDALQIVDSLARGEIVEHAAAGAFASGPAER